MIGFFLLMAMVGVIISPEVIIEPILIQFVGNVQDHINLQHLALLVIALSQRTSTLSFEEWIAVINAIQNVCPFVYSWSCLSGATAIHWLIDKFAFSGL